MPKNDSTNQYEQEVKQQQKRPPVISPTLPINGCLWIIILCALASISIKGCKMVNMKYEEKKLQHEMVMDSLNNIKATRAMNTARTFYYKAK